MQSPCWSEAQHQQEMPKSGQNPLNIAEPWHGWANLIAHGALTPGLLSALLLAAGFTVALHSSPAQAAKAQAANAKAPAQYAATSSSAPQISIQRPTHADQLRGKEQIQVHIKAGRYPAQTLEMYVDDRLATEGAVQLDASMLPTAVFNWDTKVFADGPHRLAVVVTDKQGFKSRAEVQIYINNRGEQDIIPPVVRWLNVRHGDVLQGDFTAQVEATDNFGVKWVIISLNRAISPALKPPLRAVMVNTPPYILRLRADLPADTYVLSASAWDAKDNRGDAPTIGVIVQPNIRPGLNLPPTLGGSLPLTQSGGTGPSGEDNAAKTGKSATGDAIAVVPQPTLDLSLNAPRVTMPMQERFAGDAGLIPPSGAAVTARAELNNRSARMARMDASAPRSESRAVPVTPPAVASSDVTRNTLNGQIATGAYPLERAQRAASNSKPTLAKRPELEPRLVPGLGLMTPATQRASLIAPAVPALPAKSGSPRAARPNPAQPQAEARVTTRTEAAAGAPPVAKNIGGATPEAATSAPQVAKSVGAPTPARGPQLAVAAQSRTSISRGDVSVRPRASSHANVLASLPGAQRRAGKSASPAAPNLTPLSAVNAMISRPFPAMQSRPAPVPAFAALPRGASQYPLMPSPNLSLSAMPATVAATLPAQVSKVNKGVAPGLSPTLPKTLPPAKIALNPPMPKTGAQRPLAAITVAPRAEWGTVAENANIPGTHTVRRDDTLYSIARRYQMPVAVLAAANNIKEKSTLRLGAKLALPRSLRVTYAGKPVPADAPSFMVGSVGVTPFRFLFERQGGKLEWDAKNQRVTARGPQGNVAITVGSRTAVVNQKEVLMDLAAFLMSGRTMVPVRFMEEAMQARVDWDPATGRIYVAMANPAAR